MAQERGAEGIAFDPSKYLTKVGTSDYLEVKWRLLWLREVYPDAQIFTELLSDTGQRATFRATVVLPNNGGSATGHGSETESDFREYLEKAETKALGRALAALGFGTQFCADFDHGGVVDSPIDFASTRGRRMRDTSTEPAGGAPYSPQGATPKQLKYLESIAREQGISPQDLDAQAEQLYGVPTALLERRQASQMIERLGGRP